MKPPTILAHQHHRKSDIESEISVTEYQISTATGTKKNPIRS